MQQTYIQATFTMHKISNCCNYSHAKTMDAEMWLRTTLRLRYKRTSRVFPQKKNKNHCITGARIRNPEGAS